MIEKFRHDHKSQVVHLVVLTDGQATDDMRVVKGLPGSYYGSKYTTSYISNAIIKHGHKNYPTLIEMPHGNRDSRDSITNALILYVKEISNVRVVGFSLISRLSEFSSVHSYSKIESSNNYYEEHQKLSKDGSIALTGCAYNELYVIRTDKSNFSFDTESPNFTPNNMKDAIKDVKGMFSRQANSIKKQRVVLNKFITMISNPILNF